MSGSNFFFFFVMCAVTKWVLDRRYGAPRGLFYNGETLPSSGASTKQLNRVS